MWQVIYIAPNKQAAETLKDALSREGILVSLRATGVSTNAGGTHVELLVPQGEAREAHEILNETLGRARFKK
ncbi:MAG TPA: glutamate decarboxylase [Symbiobacteriaceae bacterium]|jgi:BarA-like signal transduction histidine kinase|nr:glutamate decarboxylase [Symbiobacteriaceae bacterium]